MSQLPEVETTRLTLGDITFEGFEIPEEIQWGGKQDVNIHQLPGGQRIVDAMGANDQDIEWSGLILGLNANNIALEFDKLRQNGVPGTLTFHSNVYTVLVTEFVATFQRAYQVGYRIKCTVVSNLSAPVFIDQMPNADELVTSGMQNVLSFGISMGFTVPNSLPGPNATYQGVTTPISMDIVAPVTGDGVDLSAVAAALTGLRAGVVSIAGTADNLSGPDLYAINQDVTDATAAVAAAIDATDAVLDSSTSAGVVSGQSGAVNASDFLAYAAANTEGADLINMGNSIVQLGNNVDLANGATDITVETWSS